MKLVPILLICFTTLLQIQDTLSVVLTVDKQPCPLLKVPNGRVRYRSQKRVARIKCNKTYILMGARTATCISGTWDVPPPLCIKPDCPMLPQPRNGYWLYEYRRAVSTLICDSGYILIGSGTILCVDSQWNDTIPICQTIDSGSKTSCDFETEDLCGWTQDLNHNFDWSRQSMATPSGHIGTGPSFDHTLGQGSDGHYMYIESSSRLENDTARLLSPMYQPQLSQNACFIFWYHMFGATTGTLKVNVKLLTDDVNNMTTVFSKTGEQGDKWYGSVIHLAPVEQPFQIVIEGIRGRSYASDIAVDDVKLSSGDECEIINVPPTEFFIQTTLVTSSPSSADSGTVAQRTARPFPTYLPPPPPPPLPPLSPILTVMTSPAPPYQYTPQHRTSPLYTSTGITDTSPSGESFTTIEDETQARSEIVTSQVPRESTDLTETTQLKTTISTTTSSTSTTTTTVTPNTAPLKTTTSTTSTVTPNTAPLKTTTSTTTTTTTTITPTTAVIVPASKWTRTSSPFLTSSVVKAPEPSSHTKGIAIISGAVAVVSLLAVVIILIAARRRITLKRRNDMAEDSDVRYLTSDEVLDFSLARPMEEDL